MLSKCRSKLYLFILDDNGSINNSHHSCTISSLHGNDLVGVFISSFSLAFVCCLYLYDMSRCVENIHALSCSLYKLYVVMLYG